MNRQPSIFDLLFNRILTDGKLIKRAKSEYGYDVYELNIDGKNVFAKVGHSGCERVIVSKNPDIECLSIFTFNGGDDLKYRRGNSEDLKSLFDKHTFELE